MAKQQRCSHCGFTSAAGAVFCGNCGRGLPELPSAPPPPPPAVTTSLSCPRCGHGNPLEAVFCGNCGRSFSEVPSPPPPPTKRRGNSYLLPIILLSGLLVLGAMAALFLLPRLVGDQPPPVAGLRSQDPLPTYTPEPAQSLAVTPEAPTDEPPTPLPPTDEPPPTVTQPPPTDEPPPTATVSPPTATASPVPTSTPTPDAGPERLILGTTARGTPIEAVRFGNGAASLLFVGGLSSGFAPSTVAIAERVVSHLTANPQLVPDALTVYIILSASPDAPLAPGEYRGRLNSNGVDLNRNWDCNWVADTRWQGELMRGSGGTAPFSEQESRILRDFIFEIEPEGVIFWQARAEGGMVSPGICGSRINVSASLAGIYGLSAGYRVEDFEDVTNQTLNGDAMNSLDASGVPAVAVLLPSYNSVDWDNNLNALLAVFQSYAR